MSTLSVCIVASPFMSCSDVNGELGQEVVLKERGLSKVESFKKNFSLIKEIFDKGVTEDNLGELLVLMGERSTSITIQQFNELYQGVLNVDVSNVTLEGMLRNEYYQHKTEGYRNAIRTVFSGGDLTGFFNSLEYKELSKEDKDLLEGMYMVRTELERTQEGAVLYGKSSEPGLKVGISNDTAAVLFYMGIGASVGGGIGAGIGLVVGIVMVSVKK